MSTTGSTMKEAFTIGQRLEEVSGILEGTLDVLRVLVGPIPEDKQSLAQGSASNRMEELVIVCNGLKRRAVEVEELVRAMRNEL